jgi:hypothetical protein
VAPTLPCGPVAPAGPVAPLAPVAPVAPCGPCGPVAPVAPVAPDKPVAYACTCVLPVVNVKSTLALFANSVNNCSALVNTVVLPLKLYKPVVFATATFPEAIFNDP